jgi:Cytochrome c7 and related cytochrome c/Cytochrome c554 and c-prime
LIRLLWVIIMSTVGVVTAGPVSAQIAPQSGCADCHYAHPESPRRDHLEAWDRSAHARNNVGCERCHGGNPRVFEALPAHAGILTPGNAQSRVNRRNLPTTCGACHTGPFVAFQASKHYELLQSGDERGPTCSTCHGDVDGRVLSPKALASRCNECHAAGEVAPRAERARQVRDQYESLTVVREQLKLARSLITRMDDKQRRARLTEAYEQAQVPLLRAVDAGHRFVYDELREQLGVAQKRAEAILSTLANR